MNFCRTYFQKDLDDLKAEDLIGFFKSPQKETQYLEFKSSGEPNVDRVFSSHLKPGICSFLNSEGGIFIYGCPREDKNNPDNPFHEEFKPYSKGFLGNHDSIIRKISDGITPMPIGIRLNEVELAGGFVAVFEIQKSLNKPHQTDNIYQIRIDGQKKPAPHYLIEALMKQVSFPDIRAYIKVTDSQYHEVLEEHIVIYFTLYFVNFSEFQNAKNIRYRFKTDGPLYLELGRTVGENSVKNTDYFEIENLPFGEPLEKEYIISTKDTWVAKHRENLLNIIFHGETSPSKLTVYKFKFFEKGLRYFLEGKKAEIELNNILLSEHQKKLGLTHEESLRKSLGIDI